MCYYMGQTMSRIVSTASLKLAQRHCRVTSRQDKVTRASSSLLLLSWKSFSCGQNARSFAAENLRRRLTFSDRRDDRRFLCSTRGKKHNQQIKQSKQGEINGRIIALGKNNDWTGILDLYKKEKELFNHINYATSMSKLGRIQSLGRNDRRLEDMMIDIATQLQNPTTGSWDVQGMANVLHSVAKMKLTSNGSRRLTNTILGEDNLKILAETGNCQDIANTAWACATLGVECPSLFNAIDNKALHFVENGNPQDIANTAWACATLGVECPSLFKVIDNKALSLVENGTAQAFANTAWAFATLGVECPLLFKAIDNNALYFVENGTAQAVANTAWACATLRVQCPLLFKAIDIKALSLVENGTAQAVSSTAWACATLGVECPLLFKAIDINALYLVENGNPQDIAYTAWACATLGVECPSLFKAIENNALYLVENGKPQAVSNTVWACATLGVECSSLFTAIGSHMETLVESCKARDIAIICYSFAILDLALDHEPQFRTLWDRAIIINLDGLNQEISRQLLQTFVLVSRVMQIPPPTELLKHRHYFHQDDNRDSRSQREMSQLLEEMGVSHETEASPFPTHAFVPGLLAIDVACKECMLAIEFDGPSHFLKNVPTSKWLEGRVENGPTKAKRRFLKRLGWKVVNVRHWEWALANSKDEKKKLLAAKLLAVIKGVSSG